MTTITETMTSKVVLRTLIELKLQLYLEEINGQTFVETVNQLRNMYLRTGKNEEHFLELNRIAEKQYKTRLEPQN